MKKITSKSKVRVVELFTAGRNYQRIGAPSGLTIRQLFHKRRRSLLSKFTFAVTDGGHNICLQNLEHLGFDFFG